MIRDLSGKVAVVTGGASGIGNAMATRFAAEGMKLVIADIDKPALEKAVEELRGAGADVTGVQADVSQFDSVQSLAEQAIAAYGKVHVVCNNAGVLGPLSVPFWELTEKDWQWMIGVNFWSVVHGSRVFLPLMLRQDEEAHIVNTASSAGIAFASTIYGITKHAVVAASQMLYFQLKAAESKVGVTCLCPGVLNTNLPANNARVRPDALQNEQPPAQSEQERQVGFAGNLAQGKPPSLAADAVVDAIHNDTFWVTTDKEWDPRFQAVFDSITNRTNPAPQLYSVQRQ